MPAQGGGGGAARGVVIRGVRVTVGACSAAPWWLVLAIMAALGARVEAYLQRVFAAYARSVPARFPTVVLACVGVAFALLGLGVLAVQVETDGKEGGRGQGGEGRLQA